MMLTRKFLQGTGLWDNDAKQKAPVLVSNFAKDNQSEVDEIVDKLCNGKGKAFDFLLNIVFKYLLRWTTIWSCIYGN